MIYVKTEMNTMPETCVECEIGRRHTEYISCPLLNQVFNFSEKRPAVCPLMEPHTESLPAPSNTEPPELINTRCPEIILEHSKPLMRWELEDGEPVLVIQKEPFALPVWALIDLNSGIARMCSCNWLYLSDYGSLWLAYSLKQPPSRSLSRSDLPKMNGRPVFITCYPDADGEQLKFWALVSVEEGGEVYLENSLGGCSSYKEVESKIESFMTI